MRPWIAACLLSLLSAAALAQSEPARQVDLGITGLVEPSQDLLPGTIGKVRLRFSNSGPDMALNPFTASNFYVVSGVGAQFLLYPIAGTAPCRANFTDLCGRPGQSCSNIVSMGPGPLAPGESMECSLGLWVSERATGRFRLEFRTFDLSENVVDPVASNNTVFFDLVFSRPIAVPVMQVGSALLLGLAVALMGLWRLRA
jgi:hypothetical protein